MGAVRCELLPILALPLPACLMCEQACLGGTRTTRADVRVRAAAPIIALSMGERGLPCRILAPKFAGVLTFGALSAGRESAPGQPTVQQLRQLYRLPAQRASTQARPKRSCPGRLLPSVLAETAASAAGAARQHAGAVGALAVVS